MLPGDAESVAELADLVGDGLYITRLHYLGVVHPREGVITGMTRDGTFRIRDGKVAEPLVNLRFTVAVPDLLRDVVGLTNKVALVNSQNFYGERYPYGVMAPAVASERFTVTGVGSKPGICRRVVDVPEHVLAPALQSRGNETGVDHPRDRNGCARKPIALVDQPEVMTLLCHAERAQERGARLNRSRTMSSAGIASACG